MSNKRNLLIAICLIQLTIILGLIGILLFYDKKGVENDEEKNETQQTISDKPEMSADISASLVWWDQDNGLDTIDEYGKYFTSISPFWFELNQAGEIEEFSYAQDNEVLDTLEYNRIQILPTISNEFSAEPLASILKNNEQRADHIDAIVEISQNYDGISLNYENLPAESKNDYSNFIQELADALHAEDKLLSVHVHAKESEPGTWNGPQSQDWEVIGKASDKVKILTYDYHWSTSEAGAIAPVTWVEDVIEHAIELIPADKVSLGIPLYGYDWIGENAADLTYSDVQELISVYNPEVKFDSASQEPFFTYEGNDEEIHEVWYENAESISAKLILAKKYNLGGVDFWRLGQEDPKVWDEVENTFIQ